MVERELTDLVTAMRAAGGLAIEDRRHLFTVHPRCFAGREAVQWVRRHAGLTHEEAVAVGRLLVARRLVHHVLDEHDFEDASYFYRFYLDEEGGSMSRSADPAVA